MNNLSDDTKGVLFGAIVVLPSFVSFGIGAVVLAYQLVATRSLAQTDNTSWIGLVQRWDFHRRQHPCTGLTGDRRIMHTHPRAQVDRDLGPPVCRSCVAAVADPNFPHPKPQRYFSASSCCGQPFPYSTIRLSSEVGCRRIRRAALETHFLARFKKWLSV
jgi:hypothetical protein